ncbi:MAG: hypothetical protein DMD91_28640 [Candidatus Rokuibacteriota bacterium]|nr:MAG: hypothetical protein DMD91_28640 [Candidatus Rokubacteria bacterium]
MSQAVGGATDHPHVLRRLWQGWKRIAHKIGDFQARVLLTIFYFVIVAPFGLKAKTPRGWRQRASGAVALEQARRQF